MAPELRSADELVSTSSAAIGALAGLQSPMSIRSRN
jgi:hypothetical protein